MAYQSLIRIKSAITNTNDEDDSDGYDQADLIPFGPESEEPVTRLLQTLKSRLDHLTRKVRGIH
jgi:hypothetical protein